MKNLGQMLGSTRIAYLTAEKGTFYLHPDKITTPDGEHPLTPDVRATVETAGDIERRVTATRLLTIGIFALAAKKKKDNRELYLTVEGDTFISVREINPKKGSEARQFAAMVNRTVKELRPEQPPSGQL
jgi:hypothetical protein